MPIQDPKFGEKFTRKDINFSNCELLLKTKSTNYNARKLFEFGLGKFKKQKFSSFVLKHVMFWTLEEVKTSEWRLNNLYNFVKLIIMKYIHLFYRKNLSEATHQTGVNTI